MNGTLMSLFGSYRPTLITVIDRFGPQCKSLQAAIGLVPLPEKQKTP